MPGLPRSIHVKEDLRFGTGGRVWNTARALVAHLAEHPALISEKRRIIELGSGTGLIGIACGMLLSAHTGVDGPRVTVTDMESVMPFLRENIESNDSVDWRVAIVLKTTVFQIDDQMVVDVSVAVSIQESELVAMFILNNMLEVSLYERLLPEQDHHQAPI